MCSRKYDATNISVGGDPDGVCIFARVSGGRRAPLDGVKNLHLDDYLLGSGYDSRAPSGHEEWTCRRTFRAVCSGSPARWLTYMRATCCLLCHPARER